MSELPNHILCNQSIKHQYLETSEDSTKATAETAKKAIDEAKYFIDDLSTASIIADGFT